jgi:hypothetical protein
VRAIAIRKAADDYLRSLNKEHTCLLNELLEARGLSFKALVTEAFQTELLQTDLFKRAD